MRRTLANILLIAGASLPVPPASAQAPSSPAPAVRERPKEPAKFNDLARRAAGAFAGGDYETSERLLRQQLELDPEHSAVLYNLAATVGAQEMHVAEEARQRTGEAAALLEKAVRAGFSDVRRIRRDPTLTHARESPSVRAMLADWDKTLDDQHDAAVGRMSGRFPGYEAVADAELRVTFLRPKRTRLGMERGDPLPMVREELKALARWADRSVFGDALAGLEADDARVREPWVVIVLPTRQDFSRWAAEEYGPQRRGGFSQLGGAYEHPRKSLVAMDLGGTLRHEFFHVLHWRFLERTGQSPPIWLQEGLASLAEDMDADAHGDPRPVPSWRTNAVQRLLRLEELPTIEQHTRLEQGEFAGPAALRHYALARAVMLFLHDKGVLRDFLRIYTLDAQAGASKDPSGLSAMRAVLRLPDPLPGDADPLDDEFRAWVRKLPAAAEEILTGMASLGVSVENGEGEGVVVVAARGGGGGGAVLRAGDVILSINGRGTRDIAELVRVLGGMRPGQTAAVEVRRGGEIRQLRVPLRKKE